MKQKSSKKITSLLLAFALLVSMVALPSTALTASAAGIGEPSDIAVDRTGVAAGSTIMFGENNLQSVDNAGNPIGTPDGNPIKWRVVANDGTTLTLLADNKLGNRRYDAAGHQLWSGSDICNYLNGTGSYSSGGFLQNSFSAGEQTAMVAQYGTANETGVHQQIDSRQTVVLPSVDEMKNASSGGTWGFTTNTERELVPQDYWWLRSAGGGSNFAAFVNGSGNVSDSGLDVDVSIGVRPALKINLSSVIFTSSTVGGKPTTVGANLEAATLPTGALKLTVLDSSQALNVIATTTQQTQSGSTLNFSYDSATTGTNQWVSCVLEDNLGNVKYYGKLADSSGAASGNLSIPLTGVADGTYKLRIFSEQDNRVNHTDFASTPIDMTVLVSSGSGTVSIFGGTSAVAPTISGATTHAVPFGYATPVELDFTLTGPPTPSITVTNDDGTGATVSGSRLTIPTGLAVGNYAIDLTTSNGENPNATHTVNFEVTALPVYTISVSSGTGGTVTGGGSYTQGDSATVTATPNTGYSFKQWTESGGAVSQSASYSFTVTAARTLTAEFEVLPPNSYAVTFDPAGGTLVSGSLNQVVVSGSGATAPVVARSGYTFDGWDKDFSNVTANITVTAKWKQIPPTGVSHTITLGASGDGTVSGGGSYAENSTATVTATPNAGWSFKQWTENGAVVSTNGVYSFKVTAARTLTAEFEQGNTPPPTTSGGSSSGSGGGGSNKPDSRPVVGGTTTSTTRPLTKADATKLFDAALAAKPAGATTLSIKVRNATSVTKEVLAELGALAKKNGVTLTVHFDTVVGGKVVGRISVNPALATTNLDLSVTENKALAARFAKFYSNPLAVFTVKTAGSVAIPLPANLKPEGLVLYSYDTATNTYTVIPNAKPWVDKNGYLHFELPAGTEVVISQGKLVKK